MSEPCEKFEASISALIDGELPVPEQLPAIDHLLECPSCREFYHQARGLGEMVVTSESQEADPVPEEIWHRIAAESGMDRHARPGGRTFAFPRWAAQVAAAAVLFVGLWWILPARMDTAVPDAGDESGAVDVVLEESRGSMTEDRFLELTLEILKADRHYHRKMLEVMSVVTAMNEEPEGTPEEPLFSVKDRGRRISVGENETENTSIRIGDRL